MGNLPIPNEEVKPTNSSKENTSPESRAEDTKRDTPTPKPTPKPTVPRPAPPQPVRNV